METAKEYAVALGLGAAAVAAAWWLLYRRRAPHADPAPGVPPREAFRSPVGRVARLCLYPVKSCHRLEVDSAQCGTRGLRYDRCVQCVVE